MRRQRHTERRWGTACGVTDLIPRDPHRLPLPSPLFDHVERFRATSRTPRAPRVTFRTQSCSSMQDRRSIATAPSFIASLLAPPLCGACGERCAWRAPLCAGCDAEIARAQEMEG